MNRQGSHLNGFIKIFPLVLLAILLALAAYSFWDDSKQQPAPTPKLFTATVASTPVKKRSAPEVVLYLKERSTITSATGITGMPAGSEVKVIERMGGKITVEYQGNRLTLPARQLTDDIDLVASLTKAETPPPPPQTKIPKDSRPASTSSSANGGASFSSQVSSWWQGLCSWVASFFIKHQPPPALVDSQQKVPGPPPPSIDPQKVEARLKMIRLQEGSLRDLEKKLGRRKDIAGQWYYLKEIAEYKSRIVKMKAEIGE